MLVIRLFLYIDNLDLFIIGFRRFKYIHERGKGRQRLRGPLLDYVTHTDGAPNYSTDHFYHKLTSKDYSNDPASLFMYGEGIQKGKLHPIKM